MWIDVAGLSHERIVFSPSPLAELVSALHALTEPGHHPGLHGWTTATTASLKADLADRLHEADFLWGPTFSDIFLPFAALPDVAGQPGATVTEDLDMLDRLDDETYVTAALVFSCASHYGKGGPSPLVDEGVRRLALERADARGPRQAAFARRLIADPPTIRTWIRRLIEDCEEAFFADLWQRLRVQLAADARHKTEILRRKGLAEALAELSPAVSLDEERSRIVVDKLVQGSTTAVDPAVGVGLSLVPSSYGWPHLMVLYDRGWRPVIHYPVGAPELSNPASVTLLEDRLNALSHPMRIRICRNLARTAYTTGELAIEHGITAPEVSRHLAILKKAGLIQTRRRGRYVLHQLNLQVVARLGSDFLESVLR
ncbi:DUF5937 family protein [Streptomyces sp. MST-110588]|uniref:DUF5937 family protein n=1 Tax=Streptomyces sp. MST-110588 TaxID=2833628 RepID=UPI001F5D0D9E|nr:DUF5937 family protein [Streptomyces sp. MST-110588]